MDRRRMMIGLRRNLVIFKYGDKQLTNGELWRSSSFKDGVLRLKCESNDDGTYSSDPNYISGINFAKYSTLCIRLNIPRYAQLAYPAKFLMATGFGPASASVYEPDEWTEKVEYTAAGSYTSKFPLDKVKDGDVIFLLTNGGTTSGEYAELNIYDIWLE